MHSGHKMAVYVPGQGVYCQTLAFCTLVSDQSLCCIFKDSIALFQLETVNQPLDFQLYTHFCISEILHCGNL